MDRPSLILEENDDLITLTQELSELRELQEIISGLVASQFSPLKTVELKIDKVEVDAIKSTEKNGKVYYNWWNCSIL